MESQATPVEIVQQLIAIHTTRKEAVEMFTGKNDEEEFTDKLSTSTQQSDAFITELMGELSNYGDGVQAGVDRENEYQMMWKETMSKMDGLQPNEYARTFRNMEDSLQRMYKTIIDTKADLPASLQDILTHQAEEL